VGIGLWIRLLLGVRWGEGRIVGEVEGSSVMSGVWVCLLQWVNLGRVGYYGWMGAWGKAGNLARGMGNEETDDTG
jgi:hypothetical protein